VSIYIAGTSDCCGLGEISDAINVRENTNLRDIGENSGYGAVFATTIYKVWGKRALSYRKPEAILRRSGFFIAAEFDNPNTGHTLRLWVKVLVEAGSLKGRPFGEEEEQDD
jgi:hypothetical protein